MNAGEATSGRSDFVGKPALRINRCIVNFNFISFTLMLTTEKPAMAKILHITVQIDVQLLPENYIISTKYYMNCIGYIQITTYKFASLQTVVLWFSKPEGVWCAKS